MDPTVRDVLIAALPVVGGIVVAVLVAKITADRTMDLERAKWKRELYAKFLHASEEVRDGVRAAMEGLPADSAPDNIGPAQKALAEIKILSPKIAPHAGRLWDATGALMKGVVKIEAATRLQEGFAVPLDRAAYPALDAAYIDARKAFIEAAAKELG